MAENRFSEPGPEKELQNKLLRRIAKRLGFTANDVISNLESQIAANPQEFDQLMTEHHIEGQRVVDESPKHSLANLGLLVERAAILFEAGQLEAYHEELREILLWVDNELGWYEDNHVQSPPQLSTTREQLEPLYEEAKRFISK